MKTFVAFGKAGYSQFFKPLLGLLSTLPSNFLQNNPVIDQVHFFDPSLDTLLFPKDILKVDLALFGAKNHDIRQN
jgi:hypothetical protein